MTTVKNQKIYFVSTITYDGVKKAVDFFFTSTDSNEFFKNNFFEKKKPGDSWTVKSENKDNFIFENQNVIPMKGEIRFVEIESVSVSEIWFATFKLLKEFANFGSVIYPKARSGISAKAENVKKTVGAGIDTSKTTLDGLVKTLNKRLNEAGLHVDAGVNAATKTFQDIFGGKKTVPKSEFDKIFDDMSDLFLDLFGKTNVKSKGSVKTEKPKTDNSDKSGVVRKPQAFNLDEILKILTEGPENHTDKSASDKHKFDNEERLTKIVSDLENAGFKVNLTVNGKKIKSKKPEAKKDERPFEERLSEILKERPDVIPEIEKLLKKKK